MDKHKHLSSKTMLNDKAVDSLHLHVGNKIYVHIC